MAHSYTPGLTVTETTVLRKRRLLPIPGTVTAKTGDRVAADTVVAATELAGKVHAVNVANLLGAAPDEIRDYLIKREGEAVTREEVLAANKPLIKWFKTEVRSPITGTVDTVSTVTGQVLLREPPKALELLNDPNLLKRILKDFEACGIVGEETNKLACYLAAVSRKLEDPLAILIQSSFMEQEETLVGPATIISN